MKTIYLWTEKGWTPFDFDAEETKALLKEKNIVIGDGCELGYGCKLGDGCELGYGCKLGDGCELGYGCKLGNDCELGDGCELGDRCELGYKIKIIKSIFIAGTRNTVNWYGTGIIHIGCHKKEISWWLENYEMIGKKENYTEVEIKEYYQYIQICDQLQKSL